MKQAAIITLGCKVNAYDTTLISEGLEEKGYAVSDGLSPADLYVINTCTVTNSASAQSRQIIRKVKKLSPDSIVVVTGCYAQVNPGEVGSMKDVSYVIGNGEKGEIARFIESADEKVRQRINVGDIARLERVAPGQIKGFRGKSRAFLRVQDGCESYCSYCIIPYARGKSRSVSPDVVEKQVIDLARAGYGEIVITGIHLGGYGLDLPGRESLLKLLQRLDELDIDLRFRISSVEPTEIDEPLLDFLCSSKRICRHLHVPLQSGDKGILERMGRRYTPEYYRRTIERIVSRWEGVALGIDVITGFPGESEEAFQNGCRLIEELPAAYLHVFPYSKRDGTPAARMQGHLPGDEIRARAARLREIGEIKRDAFCRSFLGKRLDVVAIERKGRELKALSDNYIEILLTEPAPVGSQIFPVRLLEVTDNGCFGRLVDNGEASAQEGADR